MLRKVLVNTGLIVASLFVVQSVIGLGLRLHDGVPLFEMRNFARDYVDQFNVVKSSMYDERLGWRPKPNLRLALPVNGVLKNETTDAYGDRIADEARAAATPGGILATGDSYTYGADVGDSESWPAQLEAMLGAPVVNAASRGWGTDQIVIRAEDMIGVLHPRMLIVGLYWRDIERTEQEINFGAYKPYYTVAEGRLVLHNQPVPRLAGTVHDLGIVRGVLGYSYAAFWLARRLALWSTFNQNRRASRPGTGREISCLLLRRLRDRAEREHIRLLLVMVYGNLDFPKPQPPTALVGVECARGLGYETIDTWAEFAAIYRNDLARFRSLYVYPNQWSHMSAAGNRLVAEALARRLRETATAAPAR
ncbi:MAG TPA: hypothetical protein VFA12_07025 [Stellaceae bacterium]|nr:hypothetical protein [Stellaceae bacterium]